MEQLWFISHCSFCEKEIKEEQGAIIVAVARRLEGSFVFFFADAFHLTCWHQTHRPRPLKVKGVSIE